MLTLRKKLRFYKQELPPRIALRSKQLWLWVSALLPFPTRKYEGMVYQPLSSIRRLVAELAEKTRASTRLTPFQMRVLEIVIRQIESSLNAREKSGHAYVAIALKSWFEPQDPLLQILADLRVTARKSGFAERTGWYRNNFGAMIHVSEWFTE